MIRTVEAKRGTFMVYDNDQFVGKSLIQLGEFAELQAQFFERILKPEAVVVEVGANIGAHTVVLAKNASKVYAFEPQRRIYNMLCGNMALNELDNVDCFRLAAGEKRGSRKINTMDFESPENNFGGFSMDQEVAVNAQFDVVSIAPILIDCDFMKIDAEGWEAQVLKGAAPMIKDCKPVIYVENDREEKSDELLNLIEGLEYKAYWHKTKLFRDDNFLGEKKDPFMGAMSYDLLCLPEQIEFQGLERAHPNRNLIIVETLQ